MTSKGIATIATIDGCIELANESSTLQIIYKKFYSDKESFIFILNAEAVDGCKTKNKAEKIIDRFLIQGFEPQVN